MKSKFTKYLENFFIIAVSLLFLVFFILQVTSRDEFSLLPHELLDDWMRYGVQNNDWFFRVKRDWATIGAVVMTDLENARKAGYAVADIDSVRRENSMDEELQMMYLMYLSVLGRFLNNI